MVNNFERCVLKVKSKQSKSCKSKNWKGKDCVNPWAVCTKSVGREDKDKYERCVMDIKKKSPVKKD